MTEENSSFSILLANRNQSKNGFGDEGTFDYRDNSGNVDGHGSGSGGGYASGSGIGEDGSSGYGKLDGSGKGFGYGVYLEDTGSGLGQGTGD